MTARGEGEYGRAVIKGSDKYQSLDGLLAILKSVYMQDISGEQRKEGRPRPVNLSGQIKSAAGGGGGGDGAG